MQKVIEEAIEHQQKKLLRSAHRIVPDVILDDLWQPNDFIELESDPDFRYEEGVLHGLLMARTLVQSLNR